MTAFATDVERDAAAAVIAVVGGMWDGYDPHDIALDLVPPPAVPSVVGCAALLGRIYTDLSSVIAIDRRATLAAAGLWVARQEV